MKYEIFQVTKGGMVFEVGLMHHDALTHSDVAEHMAVCISTTYNTTFDAVKVVGAGFCSDGLPIKCWGHSESLDVSSRGCADEMALASSILQFNNVKISPFDTISSTMGNLYQTCTAAVIEMCQKLYVVGYPFSAPDIESGNPADFDPGMRLRCKGPSLDYTGKVVYLFAVDSTSEFYADYEGVYCVSAQDMRCIFVDNENIRRLTHMPSGVVLVNEVPQVVNIAGIVDPWPLTDDHDEFRAIYSLLGQQEQLTVDGSLQSLREFFHIESE